MKEKGIVSESEANSNSEIHSKDQISNVNEELKKNANDFDILMSQKNIAESKASIMERKVIKLEATLKESEINLKSEFDNFKLLKEDELIKFKQNFKPAAMKTISVLKEEKTAMKIELVKSKADLENLREATEKYKFAVHKYKVDLFNAEKSALESSISEHKDVLESLLKMPAQYRRKTLKKLFKKSKYEA